MNGGVIGAVNLPTLASATGVWNLEEVKLAQQQSIWPPLLTPDPYWEYVSLLLSGETATTNGAQNNTFLDSSTNNFTITRNGNTTQGSFNPYGSNWSGYFDGGTNRLTTGTSSQFNLSGINFTIEFFLYTDAYPTSEQNRIITIGPNDVQSSFTIGINPNGSIDAGVPFSTGGLIVGTANALPLRTWTHVAFTLSSNTGSLYINGIRVGTSSGWNISSSNNNYFYVGYDTTATVSAKYSGYVSNVRFVAGTALYSGTTITVPTTPLTAVTGTRYLSLQNNRVVDNSVNNFSIGTTGTVSFTKFSPFNLTYQTSFSYGAYFDGSASYLSLADNTAFNFGTNDATVEFWFNSPGTSNNYPGIISSVNYYPGGSASIRFDNTGYKNKVFMYIDTGGNPVIASTSTIAYNTWNHIAIVRQGTSLKLYLNGSLDTTVTISASLGWYLSAGGMRIGRGFDVDGADAYFPGYVSNLRLVKGTAVYTSNFTPPTTQLTAITGTSLLVCQSSTFIDNSTNNFTINTNGDARPTTFSPFTNTYSSLPYSLSISALGGSSYFDGSGDSLQAPSGACISGTGDFTAECWIYPTVIPSPYNVIACSDASGGLTMFALNTNGTIFMGRSLIDVQATSSNAIIYYQWNHIALTRQSGTMRIFVNGVQGFSGTITTNYNSGTIRFGTDGGGSALPYTGYISNFRILNDTALYTSNFVPPSSPLTAITDTRLLCNYTNGGIIDSSTINDSETVGNAQVNTTTKKYGSGSYYFDGTGDWLTFPANVLYATGTGDFTIEGWVYVANLSAVRTICATRTAAETTTGWNLAVLTNGNMQIYDNTGYAAMGAGSITINTWYYFAFVRQNNVIYSYLDGVQKASTACTRNWTQNTFWVGVTGGSSEPMNGYISDLRFTKGYARYTENFTPPVTSFPRF